MADLTTHYKERTPEETVQIIKDFFITHNLTLEETMVQQSEAGTWYCHIDLYQDEILLNGANGKGMTREYALASGYAELYERFANKIAMTCNPSWNKAYVNYNKENYGYCLSKDERKLTYQELMGLDIIKQYFNTITNNDEAFTKDIVDFITDKEYIGLPLYNLSNEKDKIYLDPRLLMRVSRSNGMASGNTLNEALVQACSELMERYVSSSVLLNNCSQTYYAIRLENIKNQDLQKKIQKIKELGYELYLIDLSYNYEVPVMMSLLIHRSLGIIQMNFGSFPVFDIAAERVITELYQGVRSFKNTTWFPQLQIPYRSITEQFINETYADYISGKIISMDLIDNIQYIDSYNKEVYIDKDKNNNDFINYYSQLSKKLNIDFYYLNNSLINEIAAVYVLIVPKDDSHNFFLGNNNYYIYDTKKNKMVFNIFKEFYDALYYHKSINFPTLINALQTLSYDIAAFNFMSSIVLRNGVFITKSDGSLFTLIDLISIGDMEDVKIPIATVSSELMLSYKKYYQLILYVNSKKYSVQEILHIFNDIFNYKITEEDIIKCTSPAYLIQRVFIESHQKYISSDSFNDLIKIYSSSLDMR